jgi:hypothetical protein
MRLAALSLLVVSPLHGRRAALNGLAFREICPIGAPQLSCADFEAASVDHTSCANGCSAACRFQDAGAPSFSSAQGLSMPHQYNGAGHDLGIVGSRERLSGATDIALVSDTHAVSVSNTAREIYLWQFCAGGSTSRGRQYCPRGRRATLLAKAPTTWNGTAARPDLIDWDTARCRPPLSGKASA